MNADELARIEAVVATAFRGIHHVPNWTRRRVTEYSVRLSVYGELATFDADELTRLVVAAHDNLVRVAICPGGPRIVTILLSPRKGRKGTFYDRHPTIEDAVKATREVGR